LPNILALRNLYWIQLSQNPAGANPPEVAAKRKDIFGFSLLPPRIWMVLFNSLMNQPLLQLKGIPFKLSSPQGVTGALLQGTTLFL